MLKLITATVLGLGMALSAAAQDAPAPTATLSGIAGPVLVNQGAGFVPAQEGMRLKPGDRVMVQEGGSAALTFDDECRMDVQANKLVTVPSRSTCAGGVAAIQPLEPAGGAAIGGATGATGTGNGGVLAMMAVVAAIDVAALNEDDSETVSP